MSDTPVYVVADTTVFMHARPLDQIDWPALVGAPAVVLVVPRQVVRELDAKKDEHEKRHMKDRARDGIAFVRRWREAGPDAQVRPGTTVLYRGAAAAGDLLDRLGLDPRKGDDLILAAAVALRDELAGARVVVLTRDGGMEFAAKDVGLDAIVLPPELEREPERDPAEAELTRLRRENEQLRSRRPKLTLAFAGGTAHRTVQVVVPTRLSADVVTAIVAQAIERFPPAEQLQAEAQRTANDLGGFRRTLADIGSGRPMPIPPHEYARYAAELERYGENVRQFVLASERFDLRRALSFRLPFQVQNTGSAQAEDVRVTLRFPPAMHVETSLSAPGPPREPPTPTKPMSLAMQGLLGASGEDYVANFTESERDALRRQLGVAFRDPWGVEIETRPGGQALVHLRWQKVQQGTTAENSDLVAVFPSPGAVRSFGIEYQMTADHTDLTKGTLHVVATADETDDPQAPE